MAMSPKGPDPEFRTSDGKDRTSVVLSFFRYCRLRARRRASVTSATATSPRAAAGATRRSHAASPDARTGRPRPSVTVTRSRPSTGSERPERLEGRLLSGSTVRFVRLHDLLDERMADDIPFVEVDE